jgi:DNA repair protein RadC
MSIRDWPVNERPREKLLANGAHSLSDAKLLAVLLGGSGRPGLDALARNAAAVILAHNHALCCDARVTTGSGVTG